VRALFQRFLVEHAPKHGLNVRKASNVALATFVRRCLARKARVILRDVDDLKEFTTPTILREDLYFQGRNQVKEMSE
jgi:hypothetical protein